MTGGNGRPVVGGRQFVDTNVLLYSLDALSSKRTRALELMNALWASGAGCVSIQVLQEGYVNLVKKVGLLPEDAARAVGTLRAWTVHTPDSTDVLEAIEVHQRHRISFWDAMIVRSAARLGCAVLWSEDLNAGQTLEGVEVRNPFV